MKDLLSKVKHKIELKFGLKWWWLLCHWKRFFRRILKSCGSSEIFRARRNI